MIRAAALCAFVPLQAEAACRHALALGLDVSGSVDATEYRLQLDGLATALDSEAVRQVLFAQPDAPIRIFVFEWSGPDHQRVILPWTSINTQSDLTEVLTRLTSTFRVESSLTTAIGSALQVGFAALGFQSECWQRTLDLSGDGPSNTGPRPQDIAPDSLPAGTTVNGLVVGSGNMRGDDARFADIKELSAYYRNYVIRGPGAFVETALGFEAYADAMERKLLRELQSLAIGMAGPARE
ncbi:DUF1194 domain-containing protein [Yoonia sediminilitoris]|uniref:Uncharacterized protein DUF1194 n=1 Tax=Yoonia sediminilitoris TaxID=1286148 RepID=A0A2T6KB61_9RHOB|nr:DUF1194 domain-containing protein [Yoonia sediminilitoris]PUB12109.1 uncharacterized protein DUF1194 [Yoonia sediminilitoris]RCW92936.1 uncharacterized protein DUF1194 [Yoonia sediminilitoris]